MYTLTGNVDILQFYFCDHPLINDNYQTLIQLNLAMYTLTINVDILQFSICDHPLTSGN